MSRELSIEKSPEFISDPFKLNIDDLLSINKKIISPNNFEFTFNEKDLNKFNFLMKLCDSDTIKLINFITRKKNLLISKVFNYPNEVRIFIIKQFVLMFVLLETEKENEIENKNETQNRNGNANGNKINYKKYKDLYEKIYELLIKVYKCLKIIRINDISEIIRFNIIYSMDIISNENYIFICSLKYIIPLYKIYINEKDTKAKIDKDKQNNEEEGKSTKNDNPFLAIFTSLYNSLNNNQNFRNFIKRNEDVENLILFQMTEILCFENKDENKSKIQSDLEEIIYKIIYLIYGFNYKKSINDILLKKVEESFYEVKKDNTAKLIYQIKMLGNQLNNINRLYSKENNLAKEDNYMPDNYFVFNKYKNSGIDFCPGIELFNKDFILVFSFKTFELEKDYIYPLISFTGEGNHRDILLRISIKNKNINIIFQNGHEEDISANLEINKAYLIVIEYNKAYSNQMNLKVMINSKIKTEISCGDVSFSNKVALKVGHHPEEEGTKRSFTVGSKSSSQIYKLIKFNGVMGEILIFLNLNNEKEFINNIIKLKGKYGNLLYFNKNNSLQNLYMYKNQSLFYSKNLKSAIEYFTDKANKINSFYHISPLSMINSNDNNTKIFVENIFGLESFGKHSKPDCYFNTREIPLINTQATYAKEYCLTIEKFVQYDGIYILILHLEYYYNILKMFVDEPGCNDETLVLNEINNSLCPLFEILTDIITYFKIDFFLTELDTLGFSLMKVFNLLGDIKPLNLNLIHCLTNNLQKLVDYKDENSFKDISFIIKNFINKLFILLCSSKYYEIENINEMKNIFILFGNVLKNNDELINFDTINLLLQFSFILDDECNQIVNDGNFKAVKKEYKSLLKFILRQSQSINIYLEYITSIFQKNYSIRIKYKLMKIYLLSYDATSLSSNKNEKNVNKECNEESSNNFFFWNIFKTQKKDEKNEKKKLSFQESIFLKYKNLLLKAMNVRYMPSKSNLRYHELLKCIMIQIMFEQTLVKNEKGKEGKEGKEIEYLFFSSESLEKKHGTLIRKESLSVNKMNKITNKSKTTKAIPRIKKSNNLLSLTSLRSSVKHEENKEDNNSNSLFDSLLPGGSLSFYVIKTLFTCLFDKLDKDVKMAYIKNDTDYSYEIFDLSFGEFNRYKKQLLYQIMCLLELIADKDVIKNTLKLIYLFLEKSTLGYENLDLRKDNKYKIRSYQNRFFHLFESKKLMNKIFSFSLKNFGLIPVEIHELLINGIINICNKSIEYHPRPFVFSFIKKCFKVPESFNNSINIIKGICENIILNLEKEGNLKEVTKESNKDEDEDEEELGNDTKKIYSYLYFNQIRLIKTLINTFENNQLLSQRLLCENNFKLLDCIQNLILHLCSSDYIFDPKIYIFNYDGLIRFNLNPSTDINNLLNYSNKDEKSIREKDKIETKMLLNNDWKVLSRQIFFVNIVELTFLVFYLIWTFNTDYQVEEQNKLFNFLSTIIKKILLDGHFISYFIDALNKKKSSSSKEKNDVSEEIIKKINSEISNKYKFWLAFNPCIRESRIVSIMTFLIFVKYKGLLLFFSNKRNESNSEQEKDIQELKKLFTNIISKAQNDIISICQFIDKLKDNKKMDIILAKEEETNKEFKDFNKNFYKYTLGYMTKNRTNFDNIRKEIEKKFTKEEENKKSMPMNLKSSNLNDINKKNIISVDRTLSKPFKTILSDKNAVIPKRNDSYNLYFKEEDYNIGSSFSIKTRNLYVNINENYINNKGVNFNTYNQCIRSSVKLNNGQSIGCNTENLLFSKNNNFILNNNFFDAEEPILCTKRDLMLKNFGFYFKDIYFNDNEFKKMKNYFMYLYPYKDKTNNYFCFEKQMNFNYPSVVKNFSNTNNYYPRLILRPDRKFFSNKYFSKSNEYYKDEMKNDWDNEEENNNNKMMHLEYGHGLLNQNSFNLFSTGIINENSSSLLNEYECEFISNKNTCVGLLKLIKHYMVFQTNIHFNFKSYANDIKYLVSSKKDEINQVKKQIIIPYTLIEQVISRKFVFFNQAVEIFLLNGKSYFINLYKEEFCDDFISKLKYISKFNKNKNNETFEIITNTSDYFQKKKYSSLWADGKLNTIEYLLLLNKFAGRSYNDLTQYLVIPWVLNDYTNINDKNNYRIMQLSMAVQDKDNLESVKANYELDKEMEQRCHFQYHYSNSGHVSLYLLRINPFGFNQIKQNGHFDSPNRQIEELQDMLSVFKDFKETSELIPEYFFMVELFLNLNYFYFGIKKNKNNVKTSLVNNIKLPRNFSSLLQLVLFHHKFINSEEISSNINKWIDNIFGENQITNKKTVINSYPPDCYEKNVKDYVIGKIEEINSLQNPDTDKQTREKKLKSLISDIKVKIEYAYFFGQVPTQMFSKAHPTFPAKKTKKGIIIPDDNNQKVDIKIVLQNNNWIHLGSNENNNNLYILTPKEIFVYNKLLKPLHTLNICKINHPFSFSGNNQNLLNSIYKNIIFEIEDCKIFFIGGYLDNTIKIHYKEIEKEKDKDKETIIYNIVTESQITCMKNVPGKNTFFTGHKNGKILKWKYELLDKDKEKEKDKKNEPVITVNRVSSIIGHKSYIKIIQINEKLDLLLSASDEGSIFIRKLYDFEMLCVIKYNSSSKSILDINFNNQIIIGTYFKKETGNIKIRTYSPNGIKLSKLTEEILLPISVQERTDEIIIFTNLSIYKTNIAFNERRNPLQSAMEDENKKDNTISANFLEEINRSIAICYFYDPNTDVLFCLFNNGQLYRVYLNK